MKRNPNLVCNLCVMCSRDIFEREGNEVFWFTKKEGCEYAQMNYGADFDSPNVDKQAMAKDTASIMKHLHKCPHHWHIHICRECVPRFALPK